MNEEKCYDFVYRTYNRKQQKTILDLEKQNQLYKHEVSSTRKIIKELQKTEEYQIKKIYELELKH